MRDRTKESHQHVHLLCLVAGQHVGPYKKRDEVNPFLPINLQQVIPSCISATIRFQPKFSFNPFLSLPILFVLVLSRIDDAPNLKHLILPGPVLLPPSHYKRSEKLEVVLVVSS